MLIVFCVERPNEEGAPFGGRIELCGSSCCLGGLRSLLKKFAVTAATISIKEYISTTTVAVLQAGELNGFDCSCLYHAVYIILNTYTNKLIHTNCTKAEHLALENPRKDEDHVIVTADKGVALVVMDKQNTSQNVKLYYKTIQFTNISPKTHLQISTKKSLRFYKTTRITISSVKQNTSN